VSLLNKLGVQYFNIPPLELDSGRTFDPSDIRSVTMDKAWFLAQVTARLVSWKWCFTSTLLLLYYLYLLSMDMWALKLKLRWGKGKVVPVLN